MGIRLQRRQVLGDLGNNSVKAHHISYQIVLLS